MTFDKFIKKKSNGQNSESSKKEYLEEIIEKALKLNSNFTIIKDGERYGIARGKHVEEKYGVDVITRTDFWILPQHPIINPNKLQEFLEDVGNCIRLKLDKTNKCEIKSGIPFNGVYRGEHLIFGSLVYAEVILGRQEKTCPVHPTLFANVPFCEKGELRRTRITAYPSKKYIKDVLEGETWGITLRGTELEKLKASYSEEENVSLEPLPRTYRGGHPAPCHYLISKHDEANYWEILSKMSGDL